MKNKEQLLQEIGDRFAIQAIIDQYAYCADTRDAQGQMALFTEDTHFVVFMDSDSAVPTQELHSRSALFPVFDNLNTYHKTMHFNGQSTISFIDEKATAITYCMAHHLTLNEDKQQLMVAAIQYEDVFFRSESSWLFAERKLFVSWIENR